MRWPHGETVSVLRAAPVLDPYSGEEIGESWDEATETPYHGCPVWPRVSEEPLAVGRSAVVTGISAALPTGADVRATDRLLIRGTVYNVDGDPFDYVHPLTGWRPGVVVQCVRKEG